MGTFAKILEFHVVHSQVIDYLMNGDTSKKASDTFNVWQDVLASFTPEDYKWLKEDCLLCNSKIGASSLDDKQSLDVHRTLLTIAKYRELNGIQDSEAVDTNVDDLIKVGVDMGLFDEDMTVDYMHVVNYDDFPKISQMSNDGVN